VYQSLLRFLTVVAGLMVVAISLATPPLHTTTISAAEDLGTWSYALPKLPVATGEVATVALGDTVYAIGGVTSKGRTNAVWRYRPADNAAGWTAARSYPGPALDHIMATAYQGKIYIFGGLRNWPNDAVNTAYVYDPATNNWTPRASLPLTLGSAGIAVIGDTIYIAGGATKGQQNAQSLLLAYKPATNSWLPTDALAPLPTRRDHLVMIALDGKLHAIGGRNIQIAATTGAHEIYNPANNTWAVAAPLEVPRGGLGGGVLNGRVVVYGGEGNGPPGGVFPDTDEYNSATNSWRTLSAMPKLPSQTGAGRHGANAAVIANVLYVPGGSIRIGNAFTDTTASFVRAAQQPSPTTTSAPTGTTSVPTTTAGTTATASTTATSATPGTTSVPTSTSATPTTPVGEGPTEQIVRLPLISS
jgi:N-acetylneuraminic acid mutarotase